MDENIITLRSANGEDIEFQEIAGIAYEGNFYVIMQPVVLLEGMDQDEALVFKVIADGKENSSFELVLDDEILDAVFAEYDKLYFKHANKK
ncbi:MAG: DUF1292 domain-containing protein [Clostridia bacterium]|nr:DUF1292 domain-containing protein [Clostridia bacterium]